MTAEELHHQLVSVACDREDMRGDIMRAVHEAQLYLDTVHSISKDPEATIRADVPAYEWEDMPTRESMNHREVAYA